MAVHLIRKRTPHLTCVLLCSALPRSPIISLAPRHAPPSPAASLGSPPSAGRHGGGGLTLQQILQQYSSSGYSQLRSGTASRRSSIEAPRSEGGPVHRDSIFSQASEVDEGWLGSN